MATDNVTRATKAIATRKWRKDWEADDAVLLAGEIGQEINSGVLKVGNGVSPWSKLRIFYPDAADSDTDTDVIDGGAP